jgi:protocatechuate 3,4-dioxygenase beta subunit
MLGSTPSQTVGPFFAFGLPFEGGERLVDPADPDAVRIAGTVYDGAGDPIEDALVEIWQANRAGRYHHPEDTREELPLEDGFVGFGRCLTDAEGRYRFVTIKPGAYPWGNHDNAWRPAHIHFSLFGTAFATRLVTQMYFPGDPLFAHDPIFQSVRDAAARERMVAHFDIGTTEPEWALGYRFDVVLRGREATPTED